MFDFFGLQRKDCLTRSTLSSDTRDRPALFPLQRHPVVWNCWYQRLMLLGDGGSLLNCCRNARWNRNNWFMLYKLQHTKRLLLRCRHYCFVTSQTERERRGEWDCACAQNLNICCFVPRGKLTSACVLKTVMADWNRSNNFDTLYMSRCMVPWTSKQQWHQPLLQGTATDITTW